MKNRKRSVALLLAVIMIISSLLTLMSGCSKGKPSVTTKGEGDVTTAKPSDTTVSKPPVTTAPISKPSDTTAPAVTSGVPGDDLTPSGKVEYTVTVKTKGGYRMPSVNLYIYNDSTLNDLAWYVATDENGEAKFTLDYSENYVATVSGVPAGYNLEAYYPISSVESTVVIESSVIENDSLLGVSYGLGAVMKDFTFASVDGKEYKLSDVLKEKDMVLLNFWYKGCGPCVSEMPYMDTAYEKFSDNVEVIALNSVDSEADIKKFGENYELSFPLFSVTSDMATAFGVSAWPTSVVIDRYGVICLIEAGALTAEKPFTKIFEYFTSDEYEQKLFTSLSELIPAELPTFDMPSSADIESAINVGGAQITYAPETNGEFAEYSWPFILASKDGRTCIKASNSRVESSYSIIYANFNLKKGQAIGFDYFTSSELGIDLAYVYINNQEIYQLSGEALIWKTCYPYVALEDGEYELAICYMKDSSTDTGEDTIYIDNVRIVSEGEIDEETYIPRYCADKLREDLSGYDSYVTVVYNESDGYYHVGDKNGPLLLANLIGASRFSDASVHTLAQEFTDLYYEGELFYDAIVDFCISASNSAVPGTCTVNKELAELLKFLAEKKGLDEDKEKEWLQMCVYYDAYGTDGKEMDDPIKGLTSESAYTAKLGKDNYVYYDRVIMPRGLKYKFVPEKSGVYRITSDSEYEVEGWIFDRTSNILLTYEQIERGYNDTLNVSMVMYLEAGVDYYINIAFYNVYQTGGFYFEVKYEAPTMKQFRLASPGPFTYEQNVIIDEITGEEIVLDGETIATGIDVAIGDDGYYHHVLSDGSLGSVVYADFIGSTPIFEQSLIQLIGRDAFNFNYSEDDLFVLSYISLYGEENVLDELKKLWGEDFDANAELLQLYDVLSGIYHGYRFSENDIVVMRYIAEYGDKVEEKLKEMWGSDFNVFAEEYKFYEVLDGVYHGRLGDMTEVMREYAESMYPAGGEHPELQGCVPVDERLAEILQTLMDSYTFEGVETSWRKLCYYYQHHGPTEYEAD